MVNLAGSSQVAPTYFLNPDNGVSYSIVMQTPQYKMDSLSALQALPITAGGNPQTPILGGIAEVKRSASSAVVSQYDIQPMVQIFATTQGRDLGAVAADVRTAMADTAKDVPKGSSVVLLGQVQTMNSAFSGLLFGLLAAVVLIYLLIVVNFQSWSDPFVIITALPAALAGIVWMLFTTQTTLSVPALTGAIMCMGVATANSVLVISFARERYEELGDPIAAALEAGFVRFRPVLMTALAMIIGMMPMALGLGEGGEQNAPLGRAVIGGLIFATIATLMFVPVVFSMVHKTQGAKAAAHRRSRMPTEPRPPVSRRKLGLFGVAALIGAALIVATGIRAREDSSVKLREWTDDQAMPTVAVALPNARALNPSIDLPGRLEAYSRAPIFARVSGYLKSWSADIGARVKAGDVIAEIEAPDLDQQLLQARADLVSQQSSAQAVGGDADAAQVAARLELRLDAGNRRAHRRPQQQEGRREIRPGQCRAAGSAGRLQEDHRAVRRRGHLARDRCRRADQCRRRCGACDVRGLRHQQAARLCQRAAELRARDQDRREGGADDAGISRTARSRRRWRPPRNRSTSPRAPRGCSSRSITPAAN